MRTSSPYRWGWEFPCLQHLVSKAEFARRVGVGRSCVSVWVGTGKLEGALVQVGRSVKVDEEALDGRANKRLMEILSIHFNVPKSRIRVIRGAKSRDKIVDVI